MNDLAYAIVSVWGLTALGCTAFVFVQGAPWRAQDRTMAWHLTATATAGALENYGLVLAALVLHHLPLLPTLTIYTLSMVIIYWRLVLLLRARRVSMDLSKLKPYRKAIVAGATAALTVAQTAIPMSTAAHGWVTVALAVLGAGGVYRVENAPLPKKPTP